MDELLKDFLVETTESLDSVDVQLVQFEREPHNQTILRNVFRLVHSIKGTCGFLGLARLEGLTHAAESLMGKLRDGATVTTEAVGVILAVIDRIKAILAALEATQAEPPGDDDDLIGVLNTLSAASPRESPVALPAPAAPAAPPVRTGDTEPAAGETARPAETPGPTASLRVSVDTLERLLNLVSELVLTRNQLFDLVRTRDDHGLRAPLQRLAFVTAELQNSVMQTRMQPIGTLWQKLPRLVRDLGLELRKDVQLVMRGAETELDRQVLDVVRDPLTHLIRNAIDHGIEHPEDRIMAGKPVRASLTLTALHAAGAITIEVADDGRGIDHERIRQKAVRIGLMGDADAARLTDGQLARLIFHPGFSTAERVTAVSGRGVGLDVVQSNIETIGGTIDLRSVRNGGCVFTLRLPLTLAIVPALLLQAGGQRYAMPQAAVVELLRLSATSEARIERIEETRMLRLRGQLLPIVDLGTALQLREAPDAAADPLVVVIATGNRRYALVVDQIIRTEDIVVKPLATLLRGISAFSGTTILGDGTVIFILEPNGLARLAGMGEEVETGWQTPDSATAPASAAPAMRLLLFRLGAAIAAVPASAVLRLEDVTRDDIARIGGRDVMRYRGKLTPLVELGDEKRALRPCILVAWEETSVGLLVDEILDVVEEDVDIRTDLARPGYFGSAILGARAVEILDPVHFLADVAPGLGARSPAAPAVLVVEPSAFFRDIAVPVLRGAGYHVTAVETAADALRWAADSTGAFAAVLAQDLPDGGPAALIARLREAAPHRLQMSILLAADAAIDVEWTDRTVSKFDRKALVAALAGGATIEARAA